MSLVEDIGNALLWLGRNTKDVEVSRTVIGKWRVGVKIVDNQSKYNTFIDTSLHLALLDAFNYVEKQDV